MILDSEILIGIAALGLTLTGFSGLVAVLGKRSTGEWREGEKVQFVELAIISLTVTFGAFIPILVASAFKTTLVSPIALGLISIAHIGCLVHGMLSVTKSEEARAEYATGVLTFLIGGGVLIIAASLGSTFGFIGETELLILLNLVWLLLVAVVNFVQLLTSSGFTSES